MNVQLLPNRRQLSLLTLTGGGLLLALYGAIRLLRRKSKKFSWKKPKDEEFELVGKVSRLFIYPIKGCSAVEVDSIRVTSHGLQSKHGVFDRSFFILDKNQRVLNSILCRAIGSVQVRIVDTNSSLALELSCLLEPHLGTVHVPLIHELSPDARIVEGKFQKDNFKGVDCGDIVAAWLKEVLDVPEARLAQHLPSLSFRPANSVGKRTTNYEREFKIIYQNYTDLHLIAESSLEALNQRLSDQGKPEGVKNIDGLNFRPNLFIKDTPETWHEDRWAHVRIGDECELEQVGNCFRCMNTTISKTKFSNFESVDSEDVGAQKHKPKLVATKEPLNTLRQFRRAKNEEEDKRVKHSPFFGCLMGTRRPGLIRVTDRVKAVIVDQV